MSDPTPDPVEALCEAITGESHGAHSWSCGQGKVHFTGCKDGCPSCGLIRAHDSALEERVRAQAAEIEKLRHAVNDIAGANQHSGPGQHCTCSQSKRGEIARAALHPIQQPHQEEPT